MYADIAFVNVSIHFFNETNIFVFYIYDYKNYITKYNACFDSVCMF